MTTPLPAPSHSGPDGTGTYFDSFSSNQMREYGDAEYKRGTKTLKQVTAERDKLAGELKALRDSGVELPPMMMTITGEGDATDGHWYTEAQLRDYGDRRAMAERERCAQVCAGLWRIDGQFTADEFAETIRKGETK